MKFFKILFWAIIIIVVVIAVVLIFSTPNAKANPGNISSLPYEHWAWNKVIGWIDFFNGADVTVNSGQLQGYASSSLGDISFDCATMRGGVNVCATSNFGICPGDTPSTIHQSNGTCSNTDSTGYLNGFAWNNKVGWISFNCSNPGSNCNGPNPYKVRIVNGEFTGWAWNNIIGWISFNCIDNPDTNCTTSNYKVKTNFFLIQLTSGNLESSIFDTQTTSTLNSIIWKGDQPYDSCIQFQIAVSNSPGGPWTYYGPGHFTTTDFNDSCSTVPNSNKTTVLKIPAADRNWIANNRYLRYKVFLKSSSAPTSTPVIDDIILNWSR